ncbi:MAG: Gfo/Idh/MocA family oxidoreductase [Deltaproteobacteria bacterium]|nr:Gfo/Idh/MocA family oxidoreductase [Deltaproteobacteria bacterium]
MTNCAVIGLGNMGKHHARIYNETAASNLVAVADINPATGQAIADRFGCRFYADYRTMIQNESIDAVSIAVPTSKHEEVATRCARNGLNVLLEKPIAADLTEAVNISESARLHDVILQVGHIEHFNPAVIKLKEILNQEKLGDLLTIVVRRVGIAPPQIQDANVIIDLAIHDIDLCNYLLDGLPDKVYCRAGNGILSDREDYADIFMEYRNVNVLIQSNWITPVKIRQMHLTGTKGYADLDFIEQKLYLAETIVEHDYDSFGSFVVKLGQSNRLEIPIENDEPLKLEIEHFLDCVRNRTTPQIDGKRATDALRVALDAWQVSQNNSPDKPAVDTE